MKKYFRKCLKTIKHSFLYLEEYRYVTNYAYYLGYSVNIIDIHTISLHMAAYREIHDPSEMEHIKQIRKLLIKYS